MIGIHIPVQVETVYLMYPGHGIVAVVILRIIQPTMAAFVANSPGLVRAALLLNGAKTTQMCATASCIIARRGRHVTQLVGCVTLLVPPLHLAHPPLPLPHRLIHLLEADQICMMCMTETLFESES